MVKQKSKSVLGLYEQLSRLPNLLEKQFLSDRKRKAEAGRSWKLVMIARKEVRKEVFCPASKNYSEY